MPARRRPLVLLTLLLCALGAEPARAQVEPEGALVAELPGGTVHAYDRGDDLCLRVDSPSSGSTTCGRVPQPLSPTAPPLVVGTGEVAAGVVPAAAVRVEVLDTERPAPIAADTIPGAYTGRARARVRFFAVSVPASDPREEETRFGRSAVYTVRAFDAGGQLVGLYDDQDARPPVAGPASVVALGRGAGQVRVSATHEQLLAPAPGAPERREDALCLELRTGGPDSSSGTSTCEDPTLPLGFPLTDEACGQGRSLALLLPVAATRARVLLGTGGRLSLTTRSLPASLGVPGRVAAGLVPARLAIRQLELLDADGREAGTIPLGLPPTAGDDCDGGISLFSSAGPDELPRGAEVPLVAPGAVVASAGGQDVLAADQEGGRLCLTAGTAAPRQLDCFAPSAAVDVTGLTEAASGTLAYGSVPAQVAAVQGVLTDGTTTDAIPTGAGAYTGLWASARRFWAIAHPAGVPLAGVRFIGASGRALGLAYGFPTPAPLAGPLRSRGRLLGQAGTRLVEAATIMPLRAAPGLQRQPVLCLVRGSAAPRDDRDCSGGGLGQTPRRILAATAQVSCGDRRTTVQVPLRSGQRVVARTSAGRRPLQVVRVGDGRVGLLVLGPRERLLSLARTGGGPPLRAASSAPAAGGQCGYGFFVSAFAVPKDPFARR